MIGNGCGFAGYVEGVTITGAGVTIGADGTTEVGVVVVVDGVL